MEAVAERARTISEPSLHKLPVATWLRARRLVFGGAAVALLGASTLGRPWLEALGLGATLLSLMPCAAMCVAGFCMKGRDGGCAKQGNVDTRATAEGTLAAGNQRIEDSTKLAS